MVSIIMPTYNRAHLIGETLDSIKSQSYKDWECIVIDDGSRDDTEVIVEALSKEDKRIKYQKRESTYKKGPSGCRNQGIDIGRGEYIIFFDSDDIVHPENLSTNLELIESSELQFCRYKKQPFTDKLSLNYLDNKINQSSEKIGKEKLFDIITQKMPFACCCVMWERKALKGQRFNENLSYAEEWEFYTRLISNGLLGVSTNNVLYYNRKHYPSNTAEFFKNDPVRIKSKIEATKLIVSNLSARNLLTPSLKKVFLRLGYSLKSIEVINSTLNESGASKIEIIKYRLGFLFYPLLRPLFILKGKLKSV